MPNVWSELSKSGLHDCESGRLTLTRLCVCAVSPNPSLLAYVKSTKLAPCVLTPLCVWPVNDSWIPNGISHPYQFDKSILHLRVVWQ